MVEAVKNSTQIKNLPTHIPANTGAGKIDNAGDESFFSHDLTSPITGYGSDFSDLSKLGGNDLSSPFFNTNSMDLSMYGPVAFNQRIMGAYKQQIRQSGYDFENQGITEDDQNNLQPLSDRLDEFRVFGKRILHREQVTENLEESKKSGKGVALYLTNCAKDGLIDPNQPISFKNLKNPLRLANNLLPVSLTATQANENIDLLSDIAIKERSPQMAASLLEATSKGGILGIGVDSKTAEKLLIESKSQFNNKEDYSKFITNVDKAYQEMFPGKSLDKYIKSNYKPMFQKLAPVSGVAAGTLAGVITAAVVSGPVGLIALAGAAIGGLIGKGIYSMHVGENEKGYFQ